MFPLGNSLPSPHGNPSNFKRNIRLKILYEYGYGTDGAQTFNYWDENLPVTLSRPDASHLIVTKPGSAMVVVSDFGEGGDVLLTIDRKRLGLTDGFGAVDLESKQPVEVTADGKVRINLKKHDFKLVRVENPAAGKGTP